MSFRGRALWCAIVCQLGCAPPRDTTAPTVALTSPATGATFVPITSAVSAAFSEAMEPSSFAAAFTLSGVTGAVTASGSTAAFTPDSPLAYDTLYSATVSTAASDLAGNPLPADYSWTFTTGPAPDLAAPMVSLTIPAANATGVGVGSAVSVVFSEPMSPATLNGATFSVAGVAGTIGVTSTIATFTPSVPLAFGTSYTATVSTGATDAAGNALAAPFSWSFTTQSDPCVPELACAPPSNGGSEICIAGRVVTANHLDQTIDGATAQQIDVALYEALAFASNPASALPLQTLNVSGGGLDACGRYATRVNLSALPNGFVTIATYGKPGTAGQGAYVYGTVLRRVNNGTNLSGAVVPLVSAALDQAWSTAAGLVGPTFAARGTLAVRYHQGGTEADLLPGTPIEGVVPLWNSSSAAANDFFFSDASATALTTISPGSNATSGNGVALLTIGTGIGNVGAGPACVKPGGGSGTLSVVGATLAGTGVGAIMFFNLAVTCA